ncbi:MAG: hypothetical protein WAU07_02610 [Microgenomates group bacterium]
MKRGNILVPTTLVAHLKDLTAKNELLRNLYIRLETSGTETSLTEGDALLDTIQISGDEAELLLDELGLPNSNEKRALYEILSKFINE